MIDNYGSRHRLLVRFRGRHTTVLGVVVLALLVLGSALAPWIAVHDPEATSPAVSLIGPTWEHPLGTDLYGRDQLSRVLHGGQISLGVGILSVLLSLVIGVPLGFVSGYWRGWPDRIISQIVDILLAFPNFLLALAIVAVLGPSLLSVVVSVGIASSPTFIRLIRGQVIQAKELPYVEAARAIGNRDSRILWRHIAPNILSPIIITATLGLGNAILAAAALSFLGVGVQAPSAEWGVMLNEGRSAIRVAWWLTMGPGVAITLAVISINLIGDGLRDSLDVTS